MSVQLLTHLGICVSDLERSVAFYRDVFGFEETGRLDVTGRESEILLELEELKLQAVYLERDGWRIELLHYPSPGHVGEGAARPMNELGLTHLSFRVTSLEEILPKLDAHGGRLLTRVTNEPMKADVVFATDPDGTRIEIIQAPGDPSRIPGQGRRRA